MILEVLLLTLAVLPTAAGQGQTPSVVVPQSTVLHLGGGRTVTGKILKETEEAVFLDLGFDVLRIPVRSIVRRETAGAGDRAKGPINEGVFSRADLPELSITEGVELVSEAVVKIEGSSAQGSGFITSKDGYVVTNFHVVKGETEVKVTLYLKSKNGFDLKTVRKVKVIAINPDMDLALLKMTAPKGVTLKSVYLADSDKVKVGDKVYAIGTPIGLERTVSSGIVSVTNRTFGGRQHFQITAAINPGNSGGPLFNLRTEVIGVTSSKIVGVGLEGLNFAIPSKYVIDFLRNRDAFAFDATRSEYGVHYLPAPRKPKKK